MGHKARSQTAGDPSPQREAWELVEHGMITEADFRQFTFENAPRLHTVLNPDFFKGTVVEGVVAKLK